MIPFSTNVVYNINRVIKTLYDITFLERKAVMSFGINGPDNIPSIQKAHHTNDGGAGNLGYFQQGKKQKDEEQPKQENDIFELSTKKEIVELEDDPLMVELDAIGTRIKTFWKMLHENFNKKNPEST